MKKNNQNKKNLTALKKIIPFFNYWKRSIELQNDYALENETESLIEIEADLGLFYSGRITKEISEVIEANLYLSQKKGKQNQKFETFKDESLGVILNPVRISSVSQRKIYSAIKIPAKITKDGEIKPHDYLLPWIPRNLLEPAIDETSPTIGELDYYEKAFHKEKIDEVKKISEYFSKAERIFNKVTGKDFVSFQLPDFERTPQASLKLRPVEIQNAGIPKLYERVSMGFKNLGCMQTFCKLPKEKSYYRFTKSYLNKNSNNHLGHFTQNFSLSTSQRSTLYKYLELKPLEALPIDGPPGTGKTTIIQSIIANSFVQSALGELKSPPIIVVCGATNQSVKNVIDSLDKLNTDQGLSSRWIPALSSYGLFCAARTREESKLSYHLQFRDGTGFYQSLLKESSVSEITKYFLSNFEKNFGKVVSLSNAAKFLLSKLRSLRSIQKKEINNLLDIKITDYLFGRFFKFSQEEYESKLNTLAVLDCKSRYFAFLLATHYWEARWLMEVKKYIQVIESPKNYNYLTEEVWRWKAMLTPTFVSTLSMAPKYFDNRNSSNAMIDTLIFDEAGQTLPEEGVIISTLAKKVLTIGDIKQLKPYSLIPESLDELECSKTKLTKHTRKDFYALSKVGVTSSKGSLMLLSKSAYPLRDKYGSGGSLNEHRRSVSKIVEFCNELSYHGRLIPKRETPSQSPFPAFSFIESSGKDQPVGSSRKNEIEARKIFEWVEDNKKLILDRYANDNLAEILAILTPFTAQARILKRSLGKSYPGMIIGTVNSLQGAEKPIIVFSATYDREEKVKYMLDRDETLVNVAVSRAKDSFIVFGSLECLRYGENRPSNLLARYCSE